QLDHAAAVEAVARDVGGPLGLAPEEAAAAILSLASERMVTAIEEITLNQGLDPREAVIIGGGGGAGLYAVAIARRLGSSQIVIPAVSAALSAAGALLSDLTADMRATVLVTTSAFDEELANRTLAELEARCERFVAGPGAGSTDTTVRYSVEARYPDQVWEIEVPLAGARFSGLEAVDAFKQEFHRVHDGLFAVSQPESEVEIVSWRAHVSCRLPGSAGVSAPRLEARSTAPDSRLAHFADAGAIETPVHQIEALRIGERLDGPALVESPVTTTVVPPGATVEALSSGSLLIHALGFEGDGEEGAEAGLAAAGGGAQ
ncbi:MAG: hydantoinase/oxoprolinase family protein, partial [Solirubrobacterales bacterium]